MPWKETTPMEERMWFVMQAKEGLFPIGELCRRYGISRKTAYKWLERFGQQGVEGLQDRSRAPQRIPHKTWLQVADKLAQARLKHPGWGARTLLQWLQRKDDSERWPAASTAHEILKRRSLIQARRKRRPREAMRRVYGVQTERPNQVMTIDFKGEFRMQNRDYCYPLTVADHFSRRLHGCEALGSTCGRGVRRKLESIFREQGLPEAMLSDNGPPFAATGLSRLSRLSVWWMRLGIQPLLIQPGRPEQNGRHERMHRTLKQQTARPPAANLRNQQESFDRFLAEYNEERPHQALDWKTPSELYEPSERSYPSRLPAVEYPGHYEVRKVSSSGRIKLRNQAYFLSLVLEAEQVGPEEVDDGIWSIYLGPFRIGRLDDRHGRVNG
ncbi:MAG TPA: IS481 family transposase [Acidobacteriota bacterium]|nr:IS481 family transposase [Acidobacteriota bacterium]